MPVRIYDIAKRLGIKSKDVLEKAAELDIKNAKVASSSLDKITAEYLEEEIAKQLKPADAEEEVVEQDAEEEEECSGVSAFFPVPSVTSAPFASSSRRASPSPALAASCKGDIRHNTAFLTPTQICVLLFCCIYCTIQYLFDFSINKNEVFIIIMIFESI